MLKARAAKTAPSETQENGIIRKKDLPFTSLPPPKHSVRWSGSILSECGKNSLVLSYRTFIAGDEKSLDNPIFIRLYSVVYPTRLGLSVSPPQSTSRPSSSPRPAGTRPSGSPNTSIWAPLMQVWWPKCGWKVQCIFEVRLMSHGKEVFLHRVALVFSGHQSTMLPGCLRGFSIMRGYPGVFGYFKESAHKQRRL